MKRSWKAHNKMLRNNERRTKIIFLFCILVIKVFICDGNDSVSKAKVIEVGNFKPIITKAPSAIKLTAANALNVSAPKDGLKKRNIKFSDLSGSRDAAAAKSYDPPPEYYRGPSSTVQANSVAQSNLNSEAASFVSKQVTFPDVAERSKYGDNTGEYNSRQLLRGGSTQGHQTGQDRISVGHYGGADHSTTHGGSASSFLHGNSISPGYTTGYDHDKRPYDAYHNAYSGGGIQYPVSTHGHDSGYYESSEAHGIPFDVYGSKGHYDGSGGEHSYSTYSDVHESVKHKGHGIDWHNKAWLAKSFLIPFAGAAVLGIAAALVSNPLLLQLGTVSAPSFIGKRRKRRDLSSGSTKSALAYHAHRPRRLTRA